MPRGAVSVTLRRWLSAAVLGTAMALLLGLTAVPGMAAAPLRPPTPVTCSGLLLDYTWTDAAVGAVWSVGVSGGSCSIGVTTGLASGSGAIRSTTGLPPIPESNLVFSYHLDLTITVTPVTGAPATRFVSLDTLGGDLVLVSTPLSPSTLDYADSGPAFAGGATAPRGWWTERCSFSYPVGSCHDVLSIAGA